MVVTMKFPFPLLVLIVLGSTQTAKITNHDEEVVKKADEQLDLGLDLDSLLSLDLDLDRMALEAEDFVRKFGVDENTLKDVKSYLNQNEMIANTARSAKNSLSKGKEMLRKVFNSCAIVKYCAAQFHEVVIVRLFLRMLRRLNVVLIFLVMQMTFRSCDSDEVKDKR